eukprot:m.488345 g.488345  ORF g.488345 m.488345 type:complete len:320 (+) comp25737_c0_seq1:119-1078(+)
MAPKRKRSQARQQQDASTEASLGSQGSRRSSRRVAAAATAAAAAAAEPAHNTANPSHSVVDHASKQGTEGRKRNDQGSASDVTATAPAKQKQKQKRARKSGSASQASCPPTLIRHNGPPGCPFVFLLAHGAGGKSESSNMQRWVALLQHVGAVCQFDYPSNRIDSYTGLHAAAVTACHVEYPTHTLVLCGVSMGCRGSVAAINELGGAERTVAGAIFFGYPLIPLPHPAVGTEQASKRYGPLMELSPSARILFISGTKDPFVAKNPQGVLGGLLKKKVKARAKLVVIDGADHGLKQSGKPKHDEAILQHVQDFCQMLAG